MTTCIASSRLIWRFRPRFRFLSFDLPDQFKEMPGLFAGLLFDKERFTQVAMGESLETAPARLRVLKASSQRWARSPAARRFEFIDKAIFEGSRWHFCRCSTRSQTRRTG